MNLSPESIIAGLMLLRAYESDVMARPETFGLFVPFSKESFEKMHGADVERMQHEGWHYVTANGGEWRLSMVTQ